MMLNLFVIKIVVAHSFRLVKDGIAHLLKDQAGFVVIGDAENGGHLTEKYPKLKPDVCLLDIDMPIINGIDALIQLRKSFPSIKALFLSRCFNEENIYRVVKAEGLGMVSEDITVSELTHAIKEVNEDRIYFQGDYSPEKIDLIIKCYEKKEKCKKNVQFSQRQKETLKFLSEGKTSKEIADLMFISINTVNSHYKSLYTKTGTKNKEKLICYAKEYISAIKN